MPTYSGQIQELFRNVVAKGIDVLTLGKTEVEYSRLTPEEEKVIRKVFYEGMKFIKFISPKLASLYEPQLEGVLAFAQVAKAKLDDKPIAYPSRSGTLGIAWLIPQLIKYSSDTPTSYSTNSWDISLTAGTEVYILGSSTAFYRAPSTEGSRALYFIFKDGLVEINSTPSLYQMKIVSEAESKYGVWTVHPLIDVQIEQEKAIYPYNTLGQLIVFNDFGVKWSAMPNASTTSTIKIIGMAIYEHDLLANLKWVS